MSGEVPQLYWYVFWVGLAIVVEGFGFYMAYVIHRRNMRVLDVLKTYADKGLDPPAAVAALLNEQVRDPARALSASPRGARLQRFVSFLFVGCVAGGVAWWMFDSAAPRWALYPTVCAAVFFSAGAVGFLLTAVVTPEH